MSTAKFVDLVQRACRATIAIIPPLAPLVLWPLKEKHRVPMVRLRYITELCSFPYPLLLALESYGFYRALRLSSTLGMTGALLALACTLFEVVWAHFCVAYAEIPRPTNLVQSTQKGFFHYLLQRLIRLVENLELYEAQLKALSKSIANLPTDLHIKILNSTSRPTANSPSFYNGFSGYSITTLYSLFKRSQAAQQEINHLKKEGQSVATSSTC